MTKVKTYPKEKLQMFKNIILTRLDKENQEVAEIGKSLRNTNQHRVKSIEDSIIVEEQENLNSLILRKKKLIEHLKRALLRIDNGTYGICCETGELIDEKRLLCVPHATKTVAVKNSRPR